VESGIDSLPLPLYHGTSTLFLDGITKSGLGGSNPIADWRILDFAKVLQPLVDQHFSRDEGWMVKAQSFGFMVEQKSAHFNFQHGDTYLSPALETAARYAVDKRYGSELLTYSLEFLQELINRKAPGVVDKLYQQYPQIFGFLDISCAPLLVRARRVPIGALMDEHGRDPSHNLQRIKQISDDESRTSEILLQQTNFRLSRSVPVSELTFWLINVKRWHRFQSEYSLHLLLVPGSCTEGAQPVADSGLPSLGRA
jgi:hypothetical protein